ncbi:MAG: class B sortase, partial [Mogibacterium sp.]|nr:class B sortase [Mogibacterium sp.]
MRSDRYKEEDKKNKKQEAPKPAQKAKKKRRGGVRDVLYRIIMLALVVVIGVSGYHIWQTVKGYMTARNTYQGVSKTAHVDPNQFTGVVDFDELLKINPDVQGWLYQKDTVINYPVVQGQDNDEYLHTLVDGTWSGGGTLFVDYRNQSNFGDFNSIIYGHHMKDGSMFRS